MPGSIGAGEPQHVFKGKRMGGHMGDENISVLNLEIVEIDQAQNLIYLKGAVPGARNGLVMLQMDGDLIVKQVAAPVTEEPKAVFDPEAQTRGEAAAEVIAEETPAEVASEAVEETPEVVIAESGPKRSSLDLPETGRHGVEPRGHRNENNPAVPGRRPVAHGLPRSEFRGQFRLLTPQKRDWCR
jgi:hypothetical protein